ncbi:MAG: histidine kinase [Chloroflexota bacterium]|nr:histidine kinase [Chloroflexota bacterium]
MLASSLYQQIADNAQAATGARLVHFAWLDPTSREVRVGAMSGLQSHAVQQALSAAARMVPNFDPLVHVRFPVDVNGWNESVYSGRAILTRFEEIVQGTVSPAVAEIARRLAGLRYTFTCPLHEGNTVIGSLAFHFVRAPTAAQQRTCEAFARQVSLTLENARLSEQQREAIDRLRELHAELESAQRERLLEHERRRIARDLHDQVEQIFFSIGLASRAALDAAGSIDQLRACLTSMRDYAEQGAHQLQAAIFALSRSELPAPGLVPGMLKLVQDFRSRTGLEVDLVVSGRKSQVSVDAAQVLHAVTREALVNIERHAHASAAVLHLSVERKDATLTIQDDGVGTAPLVLDRLADSATHFGLRDLQARVQQVGGALTLGPGDGGGFVVRARVPVRSRTEA